MWKPMLVAAAAIMIASSPIVLAQQSQANRELKAEVLKDLAPTGKLRAAINLANAMLAQGTPEAPRVSPPPAKNPPTRRIAT
jgi:hypothetical protein